ncbi:hypothetical protein U9M48_004791 [Paspalum notatum var. saurae]|uniref:Gag-pol polyprotein n=1 Tax=Paspalum notatum var. saurae TaxID=547442 RepID=A0AAQ3PQR3_PASNO
MSVHSARSAPTMGENRSPSPPPRRRVCQSPGPRHGRRRGDAVVIERIVKESTGGGGVQYPTLSRTNYAEWALLMKVNLEAAGLWHAVEPEDGDVIEYREDRLALAAILRSMPSDMLASLGRKRTARSAWNAVKTVRVGVQRVHEANARQLMKEFGNITFKEGEFVDDFSVRIVGLANNIRTLGGTLTDPDIVKKMLQVIPEHLEQIACSIETLLDVNELTVEEVTRRLREIEQRRNKKKAVASSSASSSSAPVYDSQGRLLMAAEDWMAKLKLQSGDNGGTSGSSGGNSNDKKRGKPRRGRGGGGNKGGETRGAGGPKPDDACLNCGKKGHWAKDCRSKPKKQKGQAHAAEGEEEEPMLMMALGASSPSPNSSVQATPPVSRSTVEIVEAKVFAQLGPKEERNPRRWVLDTGATNHMTGARAAFSELDTSVCGSVKFGDGSVVEIEGRGTVIFACKNGEHRAMTGANIISLGQLERSGHRIDIGSGFLRIYDTQGKLLARVPRTESCLYVLEAHIGQPVCLAARSAEAAWLWHGRYGHLGFDNLRKLAQEGLVRGLPELEHVNQVCDGCLVGKQRRSPFPAQARRRTGHPLDLVHGDLCGPITPTTPSGNQYFLLLVDDMSRYMWLRLLSRKDQAPAAIKNFQAAVEVESGRKLKVLRTDRGGEFTSVEFGEYCAKRGVQRQLTAPYSPQQNGVVERRNQSVVGMARSMLKSKDLLGIFWGEAVSTAFFILNRAPTHPLQGSTPYEAWHGEKPAVHFLRTFGCIAHVKDTRPGLKKLDNRSRRTIFIGYEQGSKAFRCYNPTTKCVVISRDIVFEEAAKWKWDSEAEASVGGAQPFTVHYDAEHIVTGAVPEPQSPPPAPFTTPAAPSTPAAPTPAPIQFATPPEDVDDADLDADHDDAPLRFRDIDAVIGPASPPGLVPRVLDDELHFTSADEPASFKEAEREPCWRQAMREEMKAIEDNSTWELASLPTGHRAIGLKWVFKVKRDEAGNVIRHKARLVAKGYVQCAGIDFNEVFAPVARMESVRALLALAAHQGHKVHHMDVKSAFLNGELKEEVFVSQPPGFISTGNEHKVLRLCKALYGLCQAPRAWNAKLDASLASLGFQRSSSEHAVYIRYRGAFRLVVGVYVDDLIITGTGDEEITAFK